MIDDVLEYTQEHATALIIGLVFGIVAPLLVDFVLFGSMTPCHTVTAYEDGSSVQHCEVRG